MVLAKVRSFFSGQSQEQFGSGQRFPLTKEITKEVRRHVASLYNADLSQYTFERRHSDHPGAKSDLVIYDPSEKAVIFGREMDGHLSFWTTS